MSNEIMKVWKAPFDRASEKKFYRLFTGFIMRMPSKVQAVYGYIRHQISGLFAKRGDYCDQEELC